MKKIIFAVLIFIVTGASNALCSSDSFTVTGSLDKINFSGTGIVTSEENKWSTFVISVSGDEWQIRVYHDNGKSYDEITCDGQSIYHICPDEIWPVMKKYGATNGFHGEIESAPIPSGGAGVGLPWLAYAFRPGASATIPRLPAPWLDPRHDPNAHIYECEITRSTNAPLLPLAIRFVARRDLIETAASNHWLASEYFVSARQAYKLLTYDVPDGFIGGQFEVTAITNMDGLVLPIGFELTTFYPPDRHVPWVTYRGTNVVLTASSQRSFAPTCPGKPIMVTDYRFHDYEQNVEFLQYITKDWIKPASSTKLQGFFRARMAKPNEFVSADTFVTFANGPSSVWRYVILVIAGISSLAVIFLSGKRKLKIGQA